MKTLIPAYGRDYTSASKLKDDFNANKDFILKDISSPYDGKYINKQDLNGEQVKLRYSKLTKLIVI
jgi:hypothetical protein